jgi:hypothetical protein
LITKISVTEVDFGAADRLGRLAGGAVWRPRGAPPPRRAAATRASSRRYEAQRRLDDRSRLGAVVSRDFELLDLHGPREMFGPRARVACRRGGRGPRAGNVTRVTPLCQNSAREVSRVTFVVPKTSADGLSCTLTVPKNLACGSPGRVFCAKRARAAYSRNHSCRNSTRAVPRGTVHAEIRPNRVTRVTPRGHQWHRAIRRWRHDADRLI